MNGESNLPRALNGSTPKVFPTIKVFSKHYSVWQVGAISALSCLILFLSLYNISIYPPPDEMPGYIDDAQHLIASQNLALYGKYDFGPALGPTVILPIAGAMRIFGANHLPGHLVMVAFLLVTLLLFYKLVSYLGGWKIALVATLIYSVAPGINTIYLGRRVMGEVPSVMFMLAGILIWFKTLSETRPRARLWKLLITGVMFGLAIMTKNQFMLLIPAWLAVWALNWLYYRQARHMDFLLPMLSTAALVLAWYGTQFFLLPNSQVLAAKNMSQWSGAASRGLLTFSSTQMKVALKFLTDSSALFGMAFPAILYAVLRSLRRSEDGLRWSLLLVLGAGWLAWFTLLSIGWYRYAFTGLTMSAIFLTFFFHDATGGFKLSLKKLLNSRLREWDIRLAGRTVLIALIVMLTLRSMIGRVGDAVNKGCDSHLQMANYINQNIPAADVIETYNPEVCYLSGHACHIPPGQAQDAVIRYVWYGGDPPYTLYPLEAPYLLIGFTSYFSGLYNWDEIEEKYSLEITMGENFACQYKLYHRNP